LGFAQGLRMLGALPRPLGLVPCAVGGSSLDEWADSAPPPSPDQAYAGAATCLFDAAVGRALAALAAAGPDSKLRAVLWYQGETDAMAEDLADSYAVRGGTLFVSSFCHAAFLCARILTRARFLFLLCPVRSSCVSPRWRRLCATDWGAGPACRSLWWL
jgi:hypothetical protein